MSLEDETSQDNTDAQQNQKNRSSSQSHPSSSSSIMIDSILRAPSPLSPMDPSSSHLPMTSTPLSISDRYRKPSTSSASRSPNSGAGVNSPDVTDRIEMRNSSELETSGSLRSPPVTAADHKDNAITVIEVQSNSALSTRKTEREAEVDPDIDGLAVTRIKISGDTGQDPEVSQVVKVTVIGSNGHHHHEEHEDVEGREPVRFDEGIGMGSQPSALNDTASEISSVVNNPSVISQIPDRFGFLGGEQYTHESEPDPAPEIVRRREMKWLQMMEKWDHYMRKDFKTVRTRCRKGIPRSVRGRAWYYLCGAAFIKKKQPDLFPRLLEQEGRTQDIEDIKKDLHRQFPWHEIFAEEGHGKRDLFNVLKAHSILNSKDGYCQAQAPIASILLMHMPAEDAFWCLVAICDKYLKGYYSPGMEQLKLDGDILFGLLKRVAPPVYKHMKNQSIDPVLYMTEWFLCAYTRTLPWASVLRVWDSFLCEGVKVLFRVGLVLLKYILGRPGVLKQCPSMYETLTMLKSPPNYVTHEQFLLHQIQRLEISDDQMRREHYKQVMKRKKAQQKLEAARKQQEKQQRKVAASQNQQQPQEVYRSHETAL